MQREAEKSYGRNREDYENEKRIFTNRDSLLERSDSLMREAHHVIHETVHVLEVFFSTRLCNEEEVSETGYEKERVFSPYSTLSSTYLRH